MATVCPTITARDQREYRQQIEEVQGFAHRIHIDFMDGIFAPTQSPPIKNAWWPTGLMADFHIMYKHPLQHLEIIISLQPHLIIIHAEADGVEEFLKETEGLGIKRGLAILKNTTVKSIEKYIDRLDHVLVFSGDLGHFGGTADLNILGKVKEIKAMNPEIEIGWDGGINDNNIRTLVDNGVSVLNIGGFIHKSPDPQKAYDTLVEVLTEGK